MTRRATFIAALSLAALLDCAQVCAQSAQRSDNTLTNAAVVKLVRAGFREKTIIAIIASRPSRFELEPERLIELKKSGVSERVILAMLSRGDLDLLTDDGWDNDDFFGGPDARQGTRPGMPSASGSAGDQPGETNIFGSSGGAKGRTRSRGGSGGIDTDTETVGSATVRIIRPPTEAGGSGSPKLEKTPSLTNDGVVQLVDAGFSEGTIIRRIENSPAEFDLSTDKLAELRRRRVTDPIIAAMKAAMGDEPARAGQPER
jgi:hypothetical protein